MSELKSLTLNGKRYDCFVDTVARANGGSGGGSAASLNKAQVNALDELFRAASYTEEVSAKYAAFCDAFGLANPDEPSDEVVVQSVKLGAVSYEYNALKISTNWDARATLVPIGQYLKKGATYKFSLGGLSGTYKYGLQIMVAEAPGMAFPYTAEETHFGGITERLIDTGYISSDTVYTVEQNNLIVAVNFKKGNDETMSDADYAEILENFTIEETVPADEPSDEVVVQSVKLGAISLYQSYIQLTTTWDARATLVPIGQYLKKGATYKFSLGSLASNYKYGVIIWGVNSAGYTFPYSDAEQTTFPAAATIIADTGYIAEAYTFTPDRDNCVFTVNFKKGNDASMGDSDYAAILANFTVEKVV